MRLAEDFPLEQVEERPLALDELASRDGGVEPLGAVDLGELLPTARVRWPLQRECRAPDGRRVELALDRPRPDALAAGLAQLTQVERPAGRDVAAGLLRELAPGRREGVLVGVVLALDDRPGAVVLARPEGAAHVAEEHLQPRAAHAIEHDPGAAGGARRHGRPIRPPRAVERLSRRASARAAPCR